MFQVGARKALLANFFEGARRAWEVLRASRYPRGEFVEFVEFVRVEVVFVRVAFVLVRVALEAAVVFPPDTASMRRMNVLVAWFAWSG